MADGGAATQPLSPVASSSFAATSNGAADSIWGWLVPSVAFRPPFPLQCSSYKVLFCIRSAFQTCSPFKVGRSSEADLVLNAAHMDDAQISKTSKLHFTLTLNEEGTVSLVDNSLNGTWVGGRRVGKGEVCCLQHCQVEFAKKNYETFLK